MTEHIKDLDDLYPGIGAIVRISDEQSDKNGRIIKEPVLVFSGGGERLAYISISDFRRWFDNKAPSEVTKALTTDTNKDEEFVVERSGREYGIDQGRGMRMVRYSAWRIDRPHVQGYGKTPNDAIYDLTHNVQPL